MTPSMRTSGRPFKVTTRITRMMGGSEPPTSRNRVCRGPLLLRLNFSSKPLGVLLSPPMFTCTLWSAFRTASGTGTGTTGPIISVRWTPLSIGGSWNALGKRDAEPPAQALQQLLGPHGPVCVADAPEGFGIAEILLGDVVQALALRDHVLAQEREALGRRQEAADQVGDHPMVRGFQR